MLKSSNHLGWLVTPRFDLVFNQDHLYNLSGNIMILNSTPGRYGGLMVSALDSGLSGPGSSPGQGQARHFTLTVLLFTQVYTCVPANMLGVTLQWTSIPSRGSSNTPSCFMLRKPELSTSPMGHMGLSGGFTFCFT